MKSKIIEISIRIWRDGFKVMTPFSTTYCESISQVCEDIELFLSDYIQVYGGDLDVKSEA